MRLELGSNEAIKQAVAGGMGVAVLSRHALGEHLADESLAILDIEDFPIHASWYIVHPRGKRLSPIAAVFQEHLVAQARELGATITFAGSFPGTTQTMPLAVFLKLEGGDPEAAVSMSLVLLALSVGVLVLVGRTQLFGAAAAGLRTSATREQRTHR